MTRLPARAHGAGRRDPETLADALEILAAALQAGLPPSDALHITAASTEWGRRERGRVSAVLSLIETGAPTRQGWMSRSDDAQWDDAHRVIGGVWDLAVQTGAPLAEAVLLVAGHLREDARLRGRLDALAAAPRASQRLLTLLPVVGPVLTLLVGADPVSLYASPVAAGSAAVGLGLTAVGWRWSRLLVAQAGRPRRYPARRRPRERRP